jgi:hypothetical protein
LVVIESIGGLDRRAPASRRALSGAGHDGGLEHAQTGRTPGWHDPPQVEARAREQVAEVRLGALTRAPLD